MRGFNSISARTLFSFEICALSLLTSTCCAGIYDSVVNAANLNAPVKERILGNVLQAISHFKYRRIKRRVSCRDGGSTWSFDHAHDQ